MTVRDLLRHTSGLIYPEMDFAYPERGLADPTADSGIRSVHMLYSWLDATAYRRDTTMADFVSALARLPLAHQPGEVHEYGLSADVLGRVVEVASGEPLDQFLQSRIFAPLHMVDTGFYVPKEKLDRLVDSPMPERPRIWDVTKPAKLFSGGGGLVSTAPDYLRFCQMLLNGGELDGVRVLSEQAVKQMTTNALPRIFASTEETRSAPVPAQPSDLASPSAPILSTAGYRERPEAFPGRDTGARISGSIRRRN